MFNDQVLGVAGGSVEIHKRMILDQTSTSWKDVTLRIHGSQEQIVLPVMAACKCWDLKCTLAEMTGTHNPHGIDLLFKMGPSYKKHRNEDQVNAKLLVKGLKTFAKDVQRWAHPYAIIGGGHFGLRQAIHYTRHGVDYQLFDRNPRIGGNAWLAHANATSRLQSESVHYQLQYDVLDGGADGILSTEAFGGEHSFWPTRDQVLDHFQAICDQYGVSPQVKLMTEVVSMDAIHPHISSGLGQLGPMEWKRYELFCRMTLPNLPEEEQPSGKFTASNIAYYPGCLVVPHRKTWPGEEIFGGQIGYGHSNEFDYAAVAGQDALIIGMGAFALENVRTFCENRGRKVTVVARHMNLVLPRMVCWWMNQSVYPPTAAMCLTAMEPMYGLMPGSRWDPWRFHSVTSTADRSVASVKQQTRWGISDVFFLAAIFGRVDVVQAEVKRFKPRAAVLSDGKVLEAVDHVIKVLGFDGDFWVDILMKTKVQVGPWPDGDWRRFVISDMSSIDAGRFGSVAISPAVSTFSNLVLWYHQHPPDAARALDCGLLPTNRSEPEIGSPAYHYTPRVGTAMIVTLISVVPEIQEFEYKNTQMKHDSMWKWADPASYVAACKADWLYYCQMFKDQGYTTSWPDYPYSVSEVERYLKMETDMRQQEEAQAKKREQLQLEKALEAKPDLSSQLQLAETSFQPSQSLQEVELQNQVASLEFEKGYAGRILPGTPLSLEPARKVLQARSRLRTPSPDEKQVSQWLQEGHQTRTWLVKQAERRGQR